MITSYELRLIYTFDKESLILQPNAVPLVGSNTLNYNNPFLEGFSPNQHSYL